MSSISVGKLIEILQNYPEDYEVIMELHHKYPISADSGKNGWIAFINGVGSNNDYKEIRLMN